MSSEAEKLKRVEWDEYNLKKNAEWQAAHPVTMKIDEPKTPYEPDRAMDEEGNFVDSDDEHHKISVNPTYAGADQPEWDEATREFARRARAQAPVVHTPTVEPPVAGGGKRVGLTLDTSAGVSHSHEEEQHKAEFEHMRKAVYADEGAKFKAMLAKAKQDIADEEEEES